MVEQHAPVEERHYAVARNFHGLEDGEISKLAEQLARSEEKGRREGEEATWEAAEKAIRGMQPGPAKVETAFDRFSANSKAILDATRELHYARHPEARPR